jgi:hypothetical protein
VNATQRAATLVLVLGLSGCGGSGSSATTPLTPLAPTNPTSAARAQASITILYPQNVLRLTSSGAHARQPRFVDPGATMIVFHDDDGIGNTTDVSVPVRPGPDGSQTVNLPIVAGNSTLSVAQCSAPPCLATAPPPYTSSHLTSNYNAFGSTLLSGVAAGTTYQAAVTLYMVVAGIGVTTDPAGLTSTAASPNAGTPTFWQSCSPATWTSYVFAYDSNLAFIGRPTGVGGVPQPQLVSQTASNGGTSRLSVDSQGVIRVQFDAAHNDVTGHFQTFDMNPADNNFLTPTADGYILFHDWLC